jgi:hypothetical protein
MFKISARGALICAVLPIGLMTAGCSNTGEQPIGLAGVNAVVAGNWPVAKQDFNQDYSTHPEHPIAVFNKGTAYHYDGNVDQADTMFSEAAVRGNGFRPDWTLEPEGGNSSTPLPAPASLTVKDHACNRLHRDNKLDANCGDQMVAAVTAPMAEPAPAIEAEATAVAPKQDRN